MTVSSTAPIIVYDCTGGTTYTYAFKIFSDTDLEVLYNDGAGNETELTLDVDYTVSGAGDASGGTVTTTTTYSAGSLQIRRVLPITQAYDLQNYGPLDAETLEAALDRIIMLIQQLETAIGSTVTLAEQIKFLYESNSDTNAFTDADETKLDGVEALADVTDVYNVTAVGAVMDSDFNTDGMLARVGDEGSYVVIDVNTYLTDADADNDMYARLNGAWASFTPWLDWEVVP